MLFLNIFIIFFNTLIQWNVLQTETEGTIYMFRYKGDDLSKEFDVSLWNAAGTRQGCPSKGEVWCQLKKN